MRRHAERPCKVGKGVALVHLGDHVQDKSLAFFGLGGVVIDDIAIFIAATVSVNCFMALNIVVNGNERRSTRK